MKYTLLQCWSDFNKGDLGIIQGTIIGIQKLDSEAKIEAISCFEFDDPRFKSDHQLLSSCVEQIHPAIFGLLNIKIFGKVRNTALFKLIAMFWNFPRMLFLLLTPMFFWQIVLNREEQKTVKAIESSDVLISKGGSFLDCTPSFRTRVGLFRILFFFLILLKMKKTYYILGQSIGPVYGRLNRLLLNYILKKSKFVFLRENVCLEKYPYLHVPALSLGFSNDCAFLLPPSANVPVSFDTAKLNIGVTFRDVEEKSTEYMASMVALITHLVSKFKASIYVFPQVSMSTDTDFELAWNAYSKLPDRYKSSLHIFSDNYEPAVLKAMYGKMDVFVGTRLHSTIFAIGMGVPSVAITYQGTKAQGIFKNIGLENLVLVDELTQEKLIKTVDYLIDNRVEIGKMCKLGEEKARNSALSAIAKIVENAHSSRKLV